MTKLSSSVANVVENGWKAVMRFKCLLYVYLRGPGNLQAGRKSYSFEKQQV